MNNIYHNQNTCIEEHYFCMLGDEDFIDEGDNPRISNKDNTKIAAKVIINKKPRQVTANNVFKSYFIKVNPSLQIFNPVPNLSSIKDKKNNHFINKICKNEWFFKEVDSIVFNKYINFLKVKNVKLLKEIERDLK